MEHLRPIVLFLLLALGVCVSHAQVVVESDSIPEIPTFTDTTGIDLPVVTDTILVDTVVAEDLYEPGETSIQYGIDTLYWGGDSTTLKHFFDKWQRL
ncbi:MAG: hypothetical protein J5799_04905, partial [Bacteroidales bacterium]|nr:hypothetical protein [Bacteroidales bacterium]